MKKRKISKETKANINRGLLMFQQKNPRFKLSLIKKIDCDEVFGYLCYLAWRNDFKQFHCSIGTTLTKWLELSINTVKTKLKTLEDAKIIKTLRSNQRGVASVFYVLQEGDNYDEIVLEINDSQKDNSDTQLTPKLTPKNEIEVRYQNEEKIDTYNYTDSQVVRPLLTPNSLTPKVEESIDTLNNIIYIKNNKNYIKFIKLIDNIIDKNLKENLFNCLLTLIEEKEKNNINLIELNESINETTTTVESTQVDNCNPIQDKNINLNFDFEMNKEIEVLKDLVSKQQKQIEVLNKELVEVKEQLTKVNERFDKQAKAFIQMKARLDSLESGNVTSTVESTQVVNTNPTQIKNNFNSNSEDEGKQCWNTLMKAKDIITSSDESYEKKLEAKKTIKSCIKSGLLLEKGVKQAEYLLKTFKEEEYKMKLIFYKEAKVALDNQVLSNEEKYDIAVQALQYQRELHTAHKIDKHTLVNLAKELDIKTSVFESPHSLVSPITKFVDSYELANNKKIAI